MDTDNLIRRASESLAVRFGTDVPYAIGRVRPFKRGFADIRSITVSVDVPARGYSALVPIARQAVASELASHGFTLDSVALSPCIGSRSLFEGGRETGIFLNQNESAPCGLGARKRGERLYYHFEIIDGALRSAIDWNSYIGRFRNAID